MKILVNGSCGFMGREIIRLAGDDFFAGVDPLGEIKSLDEAPQGADVIIDFSNHSGTAGLVDYAVKNAVPLVIATTGQTSDELQMIKDASESTPVFFAANYSIGVTLLINLAKKAAASMPGAEIEIVEIHHDRKLDAPSGTALAIAKAVQEVRPGSAINCGRSGQAKREPDEIGVQSVRIGNIVGIHEVMVGTQNEMITLKHEAYSRALFAEGALAAAKFLVGKPAGLYDMNSMINL